MGDHLKPLPHPFGFFSTPFGDTMHEDKTPADLPTAKPTPRKLNAVQTMRLGGKLEEYRSEIHPDKMTVSEVLAAVVPNLDFIPTESSVVNLCEQLGIKLKGVGDRTRTNTAAGFLDVFTRLDELARSIRQISEGIAAILKSIDDARRKMPGKAA